MSLELLVFQIEDAALAVPTLNVREVIRAAALFPLVEHDDKVEGGLNLRGEIIPVIDGRAALSFPRRAIDPADHILILSVNRSLVAIRVDRALELTTEAAAEQDKAAADDGFIDRIINTDLGPIAIVSVEKLLQLGTAVQTSRASGGES